MERLEIFSSVSDDPLGIRGPLARAFPPPILQVSYSGQKDLVLVDFTLNPPVFLSFIWVSFSAILWAVCVQ